MTIEAHLQAIEAALADGDATLSTDLGGQHIVTEARLWRGQVLVDWEPDPQAGDCLLRPAILRRLITLQAHVVAQPDALMLHAPGRVVASLSPHHATLVRQLGGARRIELTLQLAFADSQYRGGRQTFFMIERRQRVPLLTLGAEVRLRSATSPRTWPAPT